MSTPTILIVEDNPISRKTLKLTLESEHYFVTEAIDGASALNQAKNQYFDLIIQDLILPDIEGVELNRQLRAMSKYKNTPIFALSGLLNKNTHQMDHIGFTTFLLKPIDPSYLLNVVKAHLIVSNPPEILIGQGKHILIADDNPIQLKLCAMQLQNLGFEVDTAEDGVIALAKAMARQPDAIISDILMPNLDGFSLCIEIKRDPKLCVIPVILLTSHFLGDADLELAKNVGANIFLTRNPDEEKLLYELLKILNTSLLGIPLEPIELTEDIKEKHTIRSICQLERQVLDNTQLAQRCAMLTSQLSLINGIANSLTTTTKNLNEALKEVFYFCLDALGISKGALYIKAPNNQMVLNYQIGYSDAQMDSVKLLFGMFDYLTEITKENLPFAIPNKKLPDLTTHNFLIEAIVKSALIVPLFSGNKCLGILYLGSDVSDLAGSNTKEIVATLGMQFGLSLALAAAFEKITSSDQILKNQKSGTDAQGNAPIIHNVI